MDSIAGCELFGIVLKSMKILVDDENDAGAFPVRRSTYIRRPCLLRANKFAHMNNYKLTYSYDITARVVVGVR
jgi:hypothetical protein